MATKKPRGRPAKGLKAGERVMDYHRVAIRLPPDTKSRLMALSSVTGDPAWLVVTKAIDVMVRQLPASDQRLVNDLARRLVGQYLVGSRPPESE